MKLFILMAALTATSLAACRNPQNTSAKTTTSAVQSAQMPASQTQNGSLSVKGVVMHYLHLKNALASDNTNEAATVGGELQNALIALGKESMNAVQKKAYADIAGDAEENATHISKNAGNIKHQREHFQSLSEDMYDLIKALGTSQTLYKDYCPMVKAIWLSETKDIKNPYLGKSMETCGQVKETIKQ